MSGECEQFNVFIIGAQKAASSSLHFLLLEHDEVCSQKDELSIFEDPFYSRKAVDDVFDEHRKASSDAAIYLLKRPNLLCTDYVPSRIHAYNPKAQLVCILRDPASRAISSILHYMKSGVLPIQPIDEAIELIFFGERGDCVLSDIQNSVREYGMYGKYLNEWFKYFAREQFLFMEQEEMRDMDMAFERACTFLSIKRVDSLPALNSSQGKVAVNSVARLKLSAIIARCCRRSVGESMYTQWRSPQLLFRSSAHALTLFDRIVMQRLVKKSPSLEPSAEMLSRLRAYYSSDLMKCEKLTGLDLSNWKIKD
jgi:hypothetical protein